MSLDPPIVLLERTFLTALVDLDDPNHTAATRCYAELIDQYEAEHVLLDALDEDLLAIDLRWRRTLLAPVRTMYVAQQHRNAVDGALVTAPDLALTMIMVVWNKVRRIATFDPRFSAFDAEILPGVAPDGMPHSVDPHPVDPHRDEPQEADPDAAPGADGYSNPA